MSPTNKCELGFAPPRFYPRLTRCGTHDKEAQKLHIFGYAWANSTSLFPVAAALDAWATSMAVFNISIVRSNSRNLAQKQPPLFFGGWETGKFRQTS